MQMSLHTVSPVARLKAAWSVQAFATYGDTIRNLDGLPPLLERSGPFEIRLATTKREIRKIQKLRFKVFFDEGGAAADLRRATTRRDICPFDRICDHLFIVDTEAKGKSGRRKARVVGSYRLLRGEVAARHGGFYSQSEFALAPLLARHADKHFLELGRSCVHKDYRTKRVIELLWRGLWIYASHHDVDALIGCASLPGADPVRHAAALSFLHHNAVAQDSWHVAPNRGLGISMNLMDKDAVAPRVAAAGLPPLIKAYMRVGAKFGDGAVIDHQFGTTDVFTIMPMEDLALRYRAHFSQAQGEPLAVLA
jgi:putative hemolysin